jgi:hypothetical protein
MQTITLDYTYTPADIPLQGVLILLFIFTFDDTMFPRYRFNNALHIGLSVTETSQDSQKKTEKHPRSESPVSTTESEEPHEQIPTRNYKQKVALVHYFPDDKTTWLQYFRRPFYLFAFPNIVLAGIQFAFGCTAGIVSFNTISEIMTEAPYNWSAGSTGLIFLAALVGNFLG